jgi:hypothetical protein
LFDCNIFNPQGLMGFRNLAATNGSLTYVGGNPTFSSTPSGAAIHTSGTSGFQTGNHGSWISTNLVTLRVIFVMPSLPGASAFAVLFHTTSTRELGLFIGATSLDELDVGGSTPNPAVTMGWTAGIIQDFIMTLNITTGECNFYLNNVLVATRTLGLGTTSSSANQMLFGASAFGGVQLNAKYIAFMTWRRVLSASEVQQLYFDPYCFLTSAEPSNVIFSIVVPPGLMGQIWM